jgi:hypothetical protein
MTTNKVRKYSSPATTSVKPITSSDVSQPHREMIEGSLTKRVEEDTHLHDKNTDNLSGQPGALLFGSREIG